MEEDVAGMNRSLPYQTIAVMTPIANGDDTSKTGVTGKNKTKSATGENEKLEGNGSEKPKDGISTQVGKQIIAHMEGRTEGIGMVAGVGMGTEVTRIKATTEVGVKRTLITAPLYMDAPFHCLWLAMADHPCGDLMTTDQENSAPTMKSLVITTMDLLITETECMIGGCRLLTIVMTSQKQFPLVTMMGDLGHLIQGGRRHEGSDPLAGSLLCLVYSYLSVDLSTY